MHPYPHVVYTVSDLPKSGLLPFVRSARSYNPCIWLAVVVMWCMVRLLWRQFGRMKAILVPSKFMEPLVSVCTKNIIKVLPHFIQK